jgi:hypothetical protein
MAASMPARDEATPRRPAGDLISAVIDNMRDNREELRYSVVVPSRYTVVLAPAEFARLEGLLPRLQTETIRALDEVLARLNRRSWIERQVGAWRRRSRPALENADAPCVVEFVADVHGDLAEHGDILVHSELRLPGEPELGGGERTRRISTVRMSATRAVHERSETAAAGEPRRYATLTYADRRGTHHFDLVRETTTIGRGGVSSVGVAHRQELIDPVTDEQCSNRLFQQS